MRRPFFGLVRGVRIRTTQGPIDFLVPRGETARAQDIDRVVGRALVAITEAQQRDQQARIAAPPPATIYGTHVVRYGEAVTTIARRYRTTPDVIRQLNRLPNDAIRAGQRLRVPLGAAGLASPDSSAPAGIRPPAGARPQPITY